MEIFVGTTVNIYKILYECKQRDTDRHKLYHVKCRFCGFETDMRKSTIIASTATTCPHIGIDGRFISESNWVSKRLRTTYKAMLERCYNKENKDYKFYGEKGIEVCSEWKNNSSNFQAWALSNGYEENLTIDRIDSNKNYSPDNCRWVTMEDNSKYKSTTNIITVDGITHSGHDWAKICEIGINAINRMLTLYEKETVEDFIRERLKDKTKTLAHGQKWIDVYNITPVLKK